MKNLSDDELIQKVAQGNEMAFATLFDRHNGRFYGYVRSLIKDQNRAEDLTQDFWMKIIRLAESYKSQGSFVAWAYTLLRNASFNELRANKKFDGADATAIENEISVANFETDILSRFEVSDVKKSIDQLPDNQRVAILLWGVEELTYDDISHEMKLSVSAVKSLIFRARQTLEKSLPARSAK
jgi:RNA polymerase sigma-70 factor, ECF subfamily